MLSSRIKCFYWSFFILVSFLTEISKYLKHPAPLRKSVFLKNIILRIFVWSELLDQFFQTMTIEKISFFTFNRPWNFITTFDNAVHEKSSIAHSRFEFLKVLRQSKRNSVEVCLCRMNSLFFIFSFNFFPREIKPNLNFSHTAFFRNNLVSLIPLSPLYLFNLSFFKPLMIRKFFTKCFSTLSKLSTYFR